MKDYYSNVLNSKNLEKCYEIAPVRVKQFLEAEISFVLNKCKHNDLVLDLGCGYGRVSVRLLDKVRKVVGIDTSEDNIQFAREIVGENNKCEFLTMNAINLEFEDETFDLVFCIQNGISAFNVNPLLLINEAVRVTKKGGTVLFSSYSEKFWKHRLEWFELQAKEGLIGAIDYNKTKNGTIICKDGFKATTFSEKDFIELASNINAESSVSEIDNSSIFCELIVN